MSIVVDTPSESVAQQEAQSADLNQATETQEVAQDVQEEAQATPEYVPPEKYAGKTLEDVINMHQNAERALGKQGQEVGQQRQMIQQLMDAQTRANQATKPAEAENFEDVFYDDPVKAVNSAIENHPDIVRAKQERVMQAKAANVSQLESTHPDFMDIVGDKKFQEWVGKSGIRTELFRRADANYDFNAANELLDTWKQISMIDKTREVKQEQKKSRQKAMRQTSSETRSSGDSVGGKKMYRRADLIQLQVSDPTRYESLSDEITQAYQEGRVK